MSKKKLSKATAITRAINEGIAFDENLSPFQLSISDKTYMHELAKECGYRKSATSPYSLGSAFYVHLQKIANK